MTIEWESKKELLYHEARVKYKRRRNRIASKNKYLDEKEKTSNIKGKGQETKILNNE